MFINPKNSKALVSFLKSKQLILYGMGYVGGLIAEWCDHNHIRYVFSDRDFEQKKFQTDNEIVAPEELATKYSEANVVIASINYHDEIKADLKRMGFDDSCILSYLLFWPKEIAWEELEESADWDAVKERAKIFASWIDSSDKSVGDYSVERNFLKNFLSPGVTYYAPKYFSLAGSGLLADFSAVDSSFQTDVSSCLAVLMGFQNPEEVIRHICDTTRRAIILSYVTLEKMPDINFRRSINYVNDFTEEQLIKALEDNGFFLKKKATDPFDEVHSVYLFER